ncbi:MAG: hypothetical protein RJB34_1534 [Pseudomonadota bacterium]
MTTFSLTRLSLPWPRLGALVLWFGAAASAAYWFLQFPSGQSAPTPALAQSADGASQAVSLTYVARVLGVQAPAPEVSVAQSARFELVGVVAGASGQGSALIAVDGQAPKAFVVGQAVVDGVILKSLGPRQAQLGDEAPGAALFSIDLPPINNDAP